jgi:hypothetical protein
MWSGMARTIPQSSPKPDLEYCSCTVCDTIHTCAISSPALYPRPLCLSNVRGTSMWNTFLLWPLPPSPQDWSP